MAAIVSSTRARNSASWSGRTPGGTSKDAASHFEREAVGPVEAARLDDRWDVRRARGHAISGQ
jgi:hypothetical protein